MKRTRTGKRTALAAGLAAAVTLALAGGAGGAVLKKYYGFATFSPTHPGYGACSDNSYENPRACTGFAYWDRSQMDKRTAGKIFLMFWGKYDGNPGWFSNGATGGTGIIYVTRKGMNDYWDALTGRRPIPAYNRVGCDYAEGTANAYAQCQAWHD